MRNDRRTGASVDVLRVLDLTDPAWDVPAAAVDLSAAERARADRGVPVVRRRRILVRSALRRVLGTLLGLPARDVPLRADGDRPFLDGDDLRFSCSASEGLALIAVSTRSIGVDVQRHRDDEAAAAFDEGWLAAGEQRRLAALPEHERPVAVTRCWAQKEAVLKAQGVGIRRLPADVVTPVAASGRMGSWWVAPVTVPAGHVAALASPVPVGPRPFHAVLLSPEGDR
jgi:4'-phosphopantetheinyl transferase